jgi:antitoxin VapB
MFYGRPCRLKINAIYFWYTAEGAAMETAKIFWSGRSQAVRLPKEYRFDTKEVRIRRHGNSVILEAVAENWDWLDAIAGKLDTDFIQAVREQPEQQERPSLDKLFE